MNDETLKLTGEQGLEEAVAMLRAGQCVALPTETVYGLAGLAADEEAVLGIFEAKARPADHPLIVHLPSIEHLVHWATDVPEMAYQLARTFWPGPLTLLLKKHPDVSSLVTGGRDTIAVRVPSHPLFLRVLSKLNQALAAPSANPYKQLSPTTADQVLAGLNGRIPAVLDGGASEFGLESTIVDLVAKTPSILRAGPISRQALESVTGMPIHAPERHDVAVPGNVEAHYQPHTRLRCVSSEALQSMDLANTGVVCWSAASANVSAETDSCTLRELSDDPVNFGRALYQTLAELDVMGFRLLVVEQPPQTEPWAAVNDRLKRAAG